VRISDFAISIKSADDPTRFALMILFAGASMAIFLVSVRLTLWARIYHDHSWLLTSAVLVTVLGQQ
jgi:hypothetical protein